MSKNNTTRRLSASREACKLATRTSLRNIEKLQAEQSASPVLKKQARRKEDLEWAAATTPTGEEEHFQFPAMQGGAVSMTEENTGDTPMSGGTPIESVLRVIHNL